MNASQGAFVTGNYRNLFAEYGFSQDEIAAKLEDAWNKLFEGDEDTSFLLFTSFLRTRASVGRYV